MERLASSLARWSVPLLTGTLLSFTVEVLQHYVPHRMPGLTDVACNAASTALGLALAKVFQVVLDSRRMEWRRKYSLHVSSALLLLAIWFSGMIWPERIFGLGIVPKVRALLNPGQWAPLDSLSGAMPWLLAGCLVTAVIGPSIPRAWPWALLPVAFGVMLLSPGHIFTWSYLAGAMAAAVLISTLPACRRGATPAHTLAWLLWLLVEGLRPFAFTAGPQSFGWVPFKELLGVTWLLSVGVLLRKTWAYGAAFWLLSHTSCSRRTSLGLTVALIAAIETAQCWIPGRVPGVTDPAIALLACALLWLVDRRFSGLH